MIRPTTIPTCKRINSDLPVKRFLVAARRCKMCPRTARDGQATCGNECETRWTALQARLSAQTPQVSSEGTTDPSCGAIGRNGGDL